MSNRVGHEVWKLPNKGKKLCSCCGEIATHKVEIRTNWFRGDDEVYLICTEHHSMVLNGRWEDFYYDFAMTKTNRRQPDKAS